MRNMLDAIASFQRALPQHLGEDTSFEEIDELNDNLWRDAFDAMGIPQGRIRTDIVYHITQPKEDNLAHAYATGSNYYDDHFNSREDS